MYSLSDYTYHLPPELIAQYPVDPPDQCRLLVYDRDTQQLQDQIFTDLVDLISADSLLVFNNSKVLKARIPLPKISGEIFFLQQIDLYTFDALVRPGKKFKV
jgi:S-adenosylmethionine:tRNA ribosyltransferase-isomerase